MGGIPGLRPVFHCFTGAQGLGGRGGMGGVMGKRHGGLANDGLKILSETLGGSHGVVQSAGATNSGSEGSVARPDTEI